VASISVDQLKGIPAFVAMRLVERKGMLEERDYLLELTSPPPPPTISYYYL